MNHTVAPPFGDTKRIQESILAPLERICLDWLAVRVSPWLNADSLTAIGLTAMLLAGMSYVLASWWSPFMLVTNFWIAVNWFGDSLDGTVARVRYEQRPRYGFYVDHMGDTLGALFLISGLALSTYISMGLAVALMIGFLLLSINAYLATYTLATFRLSIWKLSPTEMRLMLIVINTAAFVSPTLSIFGRQFLLFDAIGIVGVVGMAVALVFSVVNNVLSLYRIDRIEYDQRTMEPASFSLRNTVVALVILAIAIVIMMAVFQKIGGIERVHNLVTQAGPWAPITYVALASLTMVWAPLSGAPVRIAAGTLFGVWDGTIYVLLGDLIGGSINFLLSRLYGARIINRLFGPEGVARTDKLVRGLGSWRGLLFARVFLYPMYDFVSYIAGLTKIPYAHYVLVSAVGGVLWSVTLVMFGIGLGEGRVTTVALAGILLVIFFLGAMGYQRKATR